MNQEINERDLEDFLESFHIVFEHGLGERERARAGEGGEGEKKVQRRKGTKVITTTAK